MIANVLLLLLLLLLPLLSHSFTLLPTHPTGHPQGLPLHSINANDLKTGGVGAVQVSHEAAQLGLSLGAPSVRPQSGHYMTKGGIQVTSNVTPLPYNTDVSFKSGSGYKIEELVNQLDSRLGVLLQSSYEFPGRYARWSIGFVDPPISIEGKQDECVITALNERGLVLLPAIQAKMEELRSDSVLMSVDTVNDPQSIPTTSPNTLSASTTTSIKLRLVPPSPPGTFSEEDRTRQPSLFSIIRAVRDLFGFTSNDGQLGLYGSFGYDLTFQFEPIKQSLERDPEQRDLLLFLPDKILVVDQDKRDAWTLDYEFGVNGKTTSNLPRIAKQTAFSPYDNVTSFKRRDTPKGSFQKSVEKAKREFAVGNLFEAVISQTFRNALDEKSPPSVLFRRLRARNPSPYGFFFNLGKQEYLVGASPEMFVRVEEVENSKYSTANQPALRVETCPISGTVARGDDALSDAANIVALLSNKKEESELTMCTDVDRNDKSRMCEAGSVKVIGRRQIEMYSRLIHTVDHVEGYLRKEYDALDAFLGHTWSVTVCGSPKAWATQFVEKTENSARAWYGGAVGLVGFDGSLNTGMTLRTVRIHKGIAEVRAGATLLYDSNPIAEEQETELKAAAMIDAVVNSSEEPSVRLATPESTARPKPGVGKRILIVDHQDSFVHTLGNYFRQTGADVETLRSGESTQQTLAKMDPPPDLVVLSPGPGNPKDFDLSGTLKILEKRGIPGFGVCLGLQGMVEYFGGELGVLSYPMHGKPSPISLTSVSTATSIFASLPATFEVARYHSLHGLRDKLPTCLEVTAVTEDNIVMGIQHTSLPFAAVQFHPESILTSPAHGLKMVENAIEFLCGGKDTGAQTVNRLEQKTVAALRVMAEIRNMGGGSKMKSALVVSLALHEHSAKKWRAGEMRLTDMSHAELFDLISSIGIKGKGVKKKDQETKVRYVRSLEESFGVSE